MNVLHAILAVTARVTTPILLASTGAIYSERSGFPNITLDAAMILGAFPPYMGVIFTRMSGQGLFTPCSLVHLWAFCTR